MYRHVCIREHWYHYPNKPYWSLVSELQWRWYSALIVVQILLWLRCIKLTRRVDGWYICPTIFCQVLYDITDELATFSLHFSSQIPTPTRSYYCFGIYIHGQWWKGMTNDQAMKAFGERNFAQVPWCTLPRRYGFSLEVPLFFGGVAWF